MRIRLPLVRIALDRQTIGRLIEVVPTQKWQLPLQINGVYFNRIRIPAGSVVLTIPIAGVAVSAFFPSFPFGIPEIS